MTVVRRARPRPTRAVRLPLLFLAVVALSLARFGELEWRMRLCHACAPRRASAGDYGLASFLAHHHRDGTQSAPSVAAAAADEKAKPSEKASLETKQDDGGEESRESKTGREAPATTPADENENENANANANANAPRAAPTGPPVETDPKRIKLTGDGPVLTTHDPIPLTDRKRTFYTLLRKDRAGAALGDMLQAYAHAFGRNMTFLGSCPVRRTVKYPIQDRYFEERVLAAKDLIRELGFGRILPIRCPPGVNNRRTAELDERLPDSNNIDTKLYRKYGLSSRAKYERAVKTPEFIRHLRTHMLRSETSGRILAEGPAGAYTIVAHVRRGDVTPCDWPDRYLPNKYYVDTIERLKKDHLEEHPDAKFRVIVFSEQNSKAPFEPFHEFARRGYELKLDTPFVEVWFGIALQSNATIMSISSFSYLGAILADPNAKIVFYPHNVAEPLEGWHVVSEEERAEVDRETQRLAKLCPPPTPPPSKKRKKRTTGKK